MDHIKSFQEVKSQDLSKDEIDELVNLVKKEISGHKTSEGSCKRVNRRLGHLKVVMRKQHIHFRPTTWRSKQIGFSS